ncbi:Na+/H+ antiporter subunit E [Lacimicrobium alkaliphilum]|uniref:Monovalent cation/H+ antiporter subunit E n=1 Tax=Lacimicrobium alkaliphilum TaxID=1526571 RepID=A0ABQ1RES1_9ALTE|nr:Na+/H+ antiporter subunit E [Lacimicrobium alkaliphilum]GGD67802.1 monovalent cation/H+ antiporter subunit E [Lacimicrobium alkaliphilum]
MNLRSRWLPMPFHSLLLLVVWLMLNGSVSLGHIILGSVLAICIPLICAPLQVPQPRIVRPFRAFRYVLMVLGDIVVANIQVALLVVGPMRRIKPGFVAVPLDLDTTLPITVLASTVTMTPGTVSAEVTKDRKWLYVHVLDMPEDEQQIINLIKQRYEAAIKEIFAC